MEFPYAPGKLVHLHGFVVDYRRSDEEYAAVVQRCVEDGRKVPRRERMPNRRWFLSLTLRRMREETPTTKLGDAERNVGTILKGWYRIGWSRYRFKTFGFEVAVGGEDSMAQLEVRSPLLSWSFGVRVPRSWLKRWVYERRSLLRVEVGYIGSIALIQVYYDDSMDNMVSYYRDERDRGGDVGFVTYAMMRNGWSFYLGGSHVWERQVASRLLGKRDYLRVERDPVTLVFQMPGHDAEYEAVLTPQVETWQRRRALWGGMRREGYDVAVKRPPMFQGKGENSWDCGDDGIFGMTVECRTPEEAVAGYIKAVERQRAKYGMPSEARA